MHLYELLLLALVTLIGVSIVWSTLRLGISPMPSSQKARRAMLQLFEEIEADADAGPVIELGSGWGNLLIPLAKQYPQREIVGYELSFFPWLISRTLRQLLGLKNLQVYRQNFLKADLSRASVVVCYLFPGGMQALEQKLMAHVSKANYLISNNFALPTLAPSKTLKIDDFYQSPVYLYTLKTIET